LGGGDSCGSVSVTCSGRLDSGRALKTDKGSPGCPGAAGGVIARLALRLAGAAAGAGGAAGRVTCTTT
jgi:hypothetical protein